MPYYYLILFLILLFCAMLELRGINHRTTLFVRFVAFFLLFFTSAFKYETGVDWRVYEAIFSLQWPLGDIFEVGWFDFLSQFGFEPGYMLFTATIKQLGGDIQCVFFVAALVNIVLLYKSLTYFSKYPILCLLGYYCFVFFILDMSGIRQAIALNIVLYAMKYGCDRKIWKYLLGIFIAGTFHQTALLLVIIYPLFHKQRLNIYFFLIAYGISLVIMLLKIKWLESVTLLLLSFVELNSTTNEKLVNYVFSSNYDNPTVNLIKVFFVVAIIMYVYIRREIILKTPLSRFSFMCMIIFGIVNNLMFELSEINSRISAYLIVFVVIVASNIIWYSKIFTNRIIINSVVIVYLFLYAAVYLLEKPATIAYYPYQNYVISELFNIKSTGEERLDKFAD